MAIQLTHNFDGRKFMWLYAKYATGCNPTHHCTGAIRGRYSKRFSRLNPKFKAGQTLVLDEFPALGWDAIYICGVSTNGYRKHENYPHNVHVAIIPQEGSSDHWEFENWVMDVENGRFEYVPSEKEIDKMYRKLPEQYWTCRMFRWAVWHYSKTAKKEKQSREMMLEKLQSIKEPLVLFTAFCDGVVCDYINSTGRAGFELCDWSDVDDHDFKCVDETWTEMGNADLEVAVRQLESGDYQTLAECTRSEDES